MKNSAKLPFLLALILTALPGHRAKAMSPAVEKADSHFCYFYQYWQYSSGSVACYGSSGTGCAVCS